MTMIMRELGDGLLPSSPTAVILVRVCTMAGTTAYVEWTGTASGKFAGPIIFGPSA